MRLAALFCISSSLQQLKTRHQRLYLDYINEVEFVKVRRDLSQKTHGMSRNIRDVLDQQES